MAYCKSCRQNKPNVNLRDIAMPARKELEDTASEDAAKIEVTSEEVTTRTRKLSVEEIVAIRRKEMSAGTINK